MVLPISESFSMLTIEERLEKAKPKKDITSSATGGGISDTGTEILYWDHVQGVWLPKMKKKI